MSKRKPLRISQCMIVKNEEKNIEKALTWGKDIMWEQIVVDTGSTDRTVELAEKLGAKVYFFQWIDDFAAAKNYAIKKAKGDWIAFLDADEYMNPEDVRKIQAVLTNVMLSGKIFDGIWTGWYHLNDDGEIFSSGTQVRFFRNLPDICYQRAIHEQLRSTKGRALFLGDASKDIAIFHTGYQNKEFTEKKKIDRNKKLIQEALQKNPEDYEMLGYLGDLYFNTEERDEAEKWYRCSVMHMPSQLQSDDQRSAMTFTNLLFAILQKEGASWNDAKDIYDLAVKLLPEEADFDYTVGCAYMMRGAAKEAAAYLEKSLEKLEKYGGYNKAMVAKANQLQVYEWLTKCYYEIGDSEKCVNYAVTYLRYNKYDIGVLFCLLTTLLSEQGENTQENQIVVDFLLKIYDAAVLKERLFLLKAAEKCDHPQFTAYVEDRLFSPEERQVLKMRNGKEQGS